MGKAFKQQTLDLKADRLSLHQWASPALRDGCGWRSRDCGTYLLPERVRACGLAGTEVVAGHSGRGAVGAVEGSAGGKGECAVGVCAVEQRVSVARAVSALSLAAKGAGGSQPLRPRLPILGSVRTWDGSPRRRCRCGHRKILGRRLAEVVVGGACRLKLVVPTPRFGFWPRTFRPQTRSSTRTMKFPG